MKQLILLIGSALLISREDRAGIQLLSSEFERELENVEEADKAELREVFVKALAAKPSIPDNVTTVQRILAGERVPDRTSRDPVKQRLGVGSQDEAKRENIRARDLNQPVNPPPDSDKSGTDGGGGGSGSDGGDGSDDDDDVVVESADDLVNGNTKEQLVELAKKEGVEVASNATKGEIAEAIVAKRAEA